ncbi:hypothetical protein AVEN_51200-1, partial [Araneus ventricosus]
MCWKIPCDVTACRGRPIQGERLDDGVVDSLGTTLELRPQCEPGS